MQNETPQSGLRSGFIIGDWAVYPDQNTIRQGDESRHLEPKVMEVLCYLAAHPGQVISRDTLISELWKGSYATDEALSRVISVLRRHLGDAPRASSYIATVPKAGYRLIMPVTALPEPEPEPNPEPAPNPEPSPEPATTTSAPEPETAAAAPELLVADHIPGSAPAAAVANNNGRRWRPLWLLALGVLLVALFIDRSPPPAPDPYSPSAFDDISDWFEFLLSGETPADTLTNIAVLPFEDISEISGNAFFSDGLTDELISSLGKTEGLNVVARSSSISFRNNHQDVRAIGGILDVHAVIEGTVKRAGDRIRVSCQLISTENGYVLWSQTYDRELADMLTLQSDISTAIVAALRTELGLTDLQVPATAVNESSMAAYQLYLNANFLAKFRGEQPLRESIELYQQALQIDSDFTRAQLGLANSLALLPSYSAADEEQMFGQALEILSRLTTTTPADAGTAAAIRGFIAFRRWQWVAAENYFREALVLAPSDPTIYVAYSQLLSATGRLEDALKAAQKAQQLDAVSPVVNQRLATAYLWTGDNLRAAEQFAIGSELGFMSRRSPEYLIFLLRMQRYGEARAVIQNLYGDDAADWMMLNIEAINTQAGNPELIAEAASAVAEGAIMPRLQVGLWLLLGDPERVYQTVINLQGNKKSMDFELLFALEASQFRDTSYFKRLARESGLTEYWEQFSPPDPDL